MKSSPEIIILFIFLSLAFLLERKPLNLILNFVGILISLAFLISIEYPEAQYFSFILIIVYTSALSILFGFIIMLNPNNLNISSNLLPILSTRSLDRVEEELIKKTKITQNKNYLNTIIFKIIKYFILLFLFFLLLYSFIPTNFYNWIEWYSYIDNYLFLSNNWNIFSFSHFLNSIENREEIIPFGIEIIEKTGRSIYSCPNTIINFIIAILILLLALISLFFLI